MGRLMGPPPMGQHKRARPTGDGRWTKDWRQVGVMAPAGHPGTFVVVLVPEMPRGGILLEGHSDFLLWAVAALGTTTVASAANGC